MKGEFVYTIVFHIQSRQDGLRHFQKSRKLCITNKYKYKIHDKIYPIQHVLIIRWERVQLDALRKQTETNIRI
jgi:hypothetical protein